MANSLQGGGRYVRNQTMYEHIMFIILIFGAVMNS